MQDINLYHLLKFYAKKWFWIVIFTVIGAAAGFIYNTYIQTPLYKSDATLLTISTEDRKVGEDSTLINNYIELLKSRRVLEPVINAQGHKISYNELATSTTVINEKDTEVIKVSIVSKDPLTSKQLLSGVIVSFKDRIKELYNLNNISIVDNANQATKPYNVHTVMLITFTSIAGFLTSMILLFFAYDFAASKKSTGTKTKTKATPKKRTTRQGGLLQKIMTLLVGAEVEPVLKTKKDSQKD